LQGAFALASANPNRFLDGQAACGLNSLLKLGLE